MASTDTQTALDGSKLPKPRDFTLALRIIYESYLKNPGRLTEAYSTAALGYAGCCYFDLAACRGTSKADAFCPQGPSLLFVTNRNRDSRLEPTKKHRKHEDMTQRNDEEMTK